MTSTEPSRVPEDLGEFLDSDKCTRRNALADIHSGTPVSELPPSLSQHLLTGLHIIPHSSPSYPSPSSTPLSPQSLSPPWYQTAVHDVRADIHSWTPVSELPPSLSKHLLKGVYILLPPRLFPHHY